MKRRLHAILAADVVGYSRLIAEDEAKTLAALRRIKDEVFSPFWPSTTSAVPPSSISRKVSTR